MFYLILSSLLFNALLLFMQYTLRESLTVIYIG